MSQTRQPRGLIRKVYFFRHGETDWNQIGRIQGHTNIPLNERGMHQARSLGPALARIKLDAILSSDLDRARETAELALLAGLGRRDAVPIELHADIRETFFGQLEGLTYEDIAQKLGPEWLKRWHSNQFNDRDISPPGGESGREVVQRVSQRVFAFLTENPQFERVGISTHGGVIRRIVHAVLPDGTPWIPIPNGILYETHFDLDQKIWILPGLTSWR